MRDIAPLSLVELETAPLVIASVTELDAPLEAVWIELGDPSGWFPMMPSCTWNGRVGGVGSSRDVVVRTFGTFREEMLAWDVDRRVAFTMTQTTSPLVKRMGEDFRIDKTGMGTRLTWRMAIYPTLAGRVVAPALKIIVARMNKIASKRLARSARATAKTRGTHAS